MPRIQLPAVTPKHRTWNKGKIVGQRRPLLPKQVLGIRARLEDINKGFEDIEAGWSVRSVIVSAD